MVDFPITLLEGLECDVGSASTSVTIPTCCHCCYGMQYSIRTNVLKDNDFILKKGKYMSNNTGNTHYVSLQGSYWADQRNIHNEVIMTSL